MNLVGIIVLINGLLVNMEFFIMELILVMVVVIIICEINNFVVNFLIVLNIMFFLKGCEYVKFLNYVLKKN